MITNQPLLHMSGLWLKLPQPESHFSCQLLKCHQAPVAKPSPLILPKSSELYRSNWPYQPLMCFTVAQPSNVLVATFLRGSGWGEVPFRSQKCITTSLFDKWSGAKVDPWGIHASTTQGSFQKHIQTNLWLTAWLCGGDGWRARAAQLTKPSCWVLITEVQFSRLTPYWWSVTECMLQLIGLIWYITTSLELHSVSNNKQFSTIFLTKIC